MSVKDHEAGNRAVTENLRLRAALNSAAYALFQIKRMAPDAVRDFASAEHQKACAILDTTTDGEHVISQT